MKIFNKYNRKGFVVVFALCAIISLGVILFIFNNNSRASLLNGERFKNSQQALFCAQSGINIAVACIKNNPNNPEENINKLSSQENVFDLEKGECSIKLIGESSKININLLVNKNRSVNRSRTDQLLRLIDLLNQKRDNPSISYGLAASIIDWIDKDDNVTSLSFVSGENSGAESDYYNQLIPSYTPGNSPFTSLEELLLVKYMTPEIFECIRDYLTVYGKGKININTAPRLVIETLSEQMNPGRLAQLIINRRESAPFESITQLQDVPGMTESIYQTIKQMVTVDAKDRYFTVISQGSVNNCIRKIYAILNKDTKSKRIKLVWYKEL